MQPNFLQEEIARIMALVEAAPSLPEAEAVRLAELADSYIHPESAAQLAEAA